MQALLQELTVLVVEPSIPQRKIIVRSLDQAGVGEVRCVDNGSEAFSVANQTLPELIVSSMYLPDMSGADLIRKLRENPNTADIPFMLISSETRFEMLDPVRQAGVVAILPKPFEPAQLEQALRTTATYLEPETLALENYDIANMNVLLVDDSRLSRRHLKRVILDLGFHRVDEAENGQEGISLLKQKHYDLVVTDLNMPVMDGQALVEHIRATDKLKDIPVLMVTSEENQARLANVEKSGVSALCDKPFEPISVKRLLENVLATSRQ